MGKSKKFEELIVWQKAHQFVLKVYKITSSFPKNELFGLTSQYRKAAVSIPANIAEGFGRTGIKDKIKFYNIAQGSLNGCYYYNILSEDLKYYIGFEIENALEETGKLLNAYISALKKLDKYILKILQIPTNYRLLATKLLTTFFRKFAPTKNRR